MLRGDDGCRAPASIALQAMQTQEKEMAHARRAAGSCSIRGAHRVAREADADITFPVGSHAGLSVTNSLMSKGVVVVHLNKQDRAHLCGLQRGDVIVTIDDLKVDVHDRAVYLIDQATMARRECRVGLLRQTRIFKRLHMYLVGLRTGINA